MKLINPIIRNGKSFFAFTVSHAMPNVWSVFYL